MSDIISMNSWDSVRLQKMQIVRKYVSALYRNIPKDAFGRPTQIVNVQSILQNGLDKDVEHFIDAPPEDCLVPISNLEGFQTIGGMPIWEILPGEPVDCFDVFKRYRSMKDAKSSRAAYKVAKELGISTMQVELMRQVYQWQDRVMAFDAYIEAERQVQLELRRQEIENRHASTAEALFKTAARYLSDHEDLMTPKIALQMLDTATKLERLASGMSMYGGRNSSQQGSEVSVNVTNQLGSGQMPNIAEEKASPVTGTGNLGEDKDRLKQVLNIMNNLNVFQEAVDTEIVEAVDAEVIEDEK